ncbi:MAG: hypothetical protein ACTHMY_24780 [Solirubrobacteraceae bacterium]
MSVQAGSLELGAREPKALSAPLLMLVGVLALVAALVVALLPNDVHGDTWIALMAGREVAAHGIPSHETLTIAAYGRPWIDQQWLAQLGIYELYRLGGFALIGLVDALLLVGAVVGAICGAMRLGARLRSVGWILPVAVVGLLGGLEVRTQAYAYPLLVVLVYLLARDARRPTPNVWWCLPLLVLWGNLHGSAIMAAGLVSLRGVTVGWERRRNILHSARAWGKPLALALGPPLCLMANPYGPSIASYYRATVFNSELRKLVAEWQPVTHNATLTIALVVLVALGAWSLHRHPGQSTTWDRVALLILAIGGLVAVRNVVWFTLASLVLLPVWIDPGARVPGWRIRRSSLLATGVAIVGLAWLVQASVTTFTTDATAWAPDFPPAALATVRAELTVHPGWRVYADDALADWLLWKLPGVRGHIATDARFELLRAGQLVSQTDLASGGGANWKLAARGDRLLVLNPTWYPHAAAGFRHEPGARTIYVDRRAVVIVRSAAAARD